MTDDVANLHRHTGEVSRVNRAELLGHRGATVWLTGLPAAGKSTVAVALEAALHHRGKLVYRLDGDNVRLGLNRNLGFSAADRAENIRRVGEVAKLFVDAGVIVLASFVSPYAADRDLARTLHVDAGMTFLEVYVEVSLATAERRDPKGLYKKARAGQLAHFTGIDDPYEPPTQPDLILHTERTTVDEEVQLLIDLLDRRGILRP